MLPIIYIWYPLLNLSCKRDVLFVVGRGICWCWISKKVLGDTILRVGQLGEYGIFYGCRKHEAEKFGQILVMASNNNAGRIICIGNQLFEPDRHLTGRPNRWLGNKLDGKDVSACHCRCIAFTNLHCDVCWRSLLSGHGGARTWSRYRSDIFAKTFPFLFLATSQFSSA